ncbi:ATP-dependent RNA helicase dhx37 [Gaertneriomyces sp. JEL0708]|nr:ATP-dependent RNA helicase dhx37 [Gaertneriomyces sp. JEL0708]
MGKLRPRYNEKARSSSKLVKSAKPHPHARDGGIKALAKRGGEEEASMNNNTVMLNNEDVDTYMASESAVPLVLLPGEKGPSQSKLDMSVLKEEPTGKMTSKKKKRLEKFIEKQLKKEERVKLLEKLSEDKFESELLRSSKRLGQTKLTKKQKLRQALLEERAGIQSSDTGVRLVVEKEIDHEVETSELMDLDDVNGSEDDEEEDDEVNAMPLASGTELPVPEPGIVSRAFGAALKSAATVEVVAPFGDSTSTTPTPTKPVFGAALKRKADDGAASGESVQIPIPKRQKKKQQKKKKVVVEKEESSDSGSDSDDTETEEGDKHEATTADVKSKAIWATDVIDGAEITPAPASTITETKGKPKPIPKARTVPVKSAYHVPVLRTDAIKLARISLPVVMEEQPIMEAILHHDITILCGETGSGKTTQVPQFLYEAGFGDPLHPQFPGMIGITQPRRVAAVSMAKRVSEEMSLNKGEVAYQVRYDKGMTNGSTRIKFMTDGILLRELSSATGADSPKSRNKSPADLLLSKYSCIIIDEAHERTVGTDVLIGWLTRIVKLRNSGQIRGVKPLKLVIMSATLRVEDFTGNSSLFPEARPPVVKVDGRQHKVVVHYNKQTPEDYVGEAYKKVMKIHTKLPSGGILVFLTGQQEIQVLVKKLRKAFPQKQDRELESVEHEMSEAGKGKGESLFEEAEDNALADSSAPIDTTGVDDYDDNDDVDVDGDDEESDVEVLGGVSDDEDEDSGMVLNKSGADTPLHILPLYSLLPTAAQMRVFADPPPGTRLVVVATNVAETSLTIPGIKYVVDSGKVKQRQYDISSGVQTYQIAWTSRASADQRAGRAGRTASGHCYRLFSSAVFNDYFEQFSPPEILRVPIEGVVLQMKSMGIENVVGFPFPTPPGRENLKAAEQMLTQLGALEPVQEKKKAVVWRITELGKLMARFPVSPRFSKMIIVAATQKKNNVLPYVIAIIAGLSVGEPFIRDEDIIGNGNKRTGSDDDDSDSDEAETEKDRRKKKRSAFWRTMALFSGKNPTSDALRLVSAIGAYTFEVSQSSASAEKFCATHFLRPKSMEEIRKLRAQLTNLTKTTLGEDLNHYPSIASLCVDPSLPPPTASQAGAIRQIILAGSSDRVAKLDENASRGFAGQKYVPVYRTMWGAKNEVCQVHPTSCVSGERPAPEYVVYDELLGKEEKIAADNSGLVGTRQNAAIVVDGVEVKKLWMKGITIIDSTWIASIAPKSLVKSGKIAEQPAPKWVEDQDKIMGYCSSTMGPKLWELPVQRVELPYLRDRCRWFARTLLEGKITNLMAERKWKLKTKKQQEEWELEHTEVLPLLRQYLNADPTNVTKDTTKHQQKVVDFVEALVKADVDSKAKLLSHWRSEGAKPQFLLREYLAWLPSEFENCLAANWPPAVLVLREDDDGSDARRRRALVRGVKEMMGMVKQSEAVDEKQVAWSSDEDSDY